MSVVATGPGRVPVAAVRRNAIRIVLKNLVVIVACAVVAVLAAFLVTQTTPDVYRSTVTLVAPSSAKVQTYARLASTEAVLTEAVQASGVTIAASDAAGLVSSSLPKNTALVVVEVTSADRAVPQPLASAIADSLVRQAVLMEQAEPSNEEPPLRVVDTASEASPFGRSRLMTLAMAALLGAGIGLCFALIRDIRGSRLRSAKEVRSMTSVPVSELRDGSDDGLADLLGLATDAGQVWYVHGVAPSPAAHVSDAAARIAATLVAKGSRVRLLDLNPVIDGVEPTAAEPDLSDVFLRGTDWREAVETDATEAYTRLRRARATVDTKAALRSERAKALLSGAARDVDTLIVVLPSDAGDDDRAAVRSMVPGVSVGVVTLRQTTRRHLAAWAASVEDAAAALVVSR